MKAYIIGVDMGYGHLRAAHPLLPFAAVPTSWNLKEGVVITANDYPGIPLSDRLLWEGVRKTFEWFSRTREIPYIGKYLFEILDYVQRIEPFYPIRDLTKATFQTRSLYSTIKKGHGRHLIETLNRDPLPLIATFFAAAFFAEEHGYKGEIYCICTDSDISRAWAPLNPSKSRIIYLAPSHTVVERLLMYGVQKSKIILTGFPLPKKILGERSSLSIMHSSIRRRLSKLDPKGEFRKYWVPYIKKEFGHINENESGPIVITYAVGGAGAQYKIGLSILDALKDLIRTEKIKLNLVAGSSLRIYKKYKKILREIGLSEKGVDIIYKKDKFDYFEEFDEVLKETDVLWTKPSELSFYAGAGLPIIIAPQLGDQEKCNREWLIRHGAGIDEPEEMNIRTWFDNFLSKGKLAEAAMNGYLKIEKLGTFNIEDVIFKGPRP